MKSLCCFLLRVCLYASPAVVLVGSGCSTPDSTQINRPSLDVNHTRQLLLETSFNPSNGVAFASVAYHDGTASGFGPGVLIKCNNTVILDTRTGGSGADTGRFLSSQLNTGDYFWEYEGLDTSFSFHMPAHTTMTISQPFSSNPLMRTESFSLVYSPAGACTALHVLLRDNQGNTDTPVIQFDSTTGLIQPVLPDAGVLAAGFGSITITKTNVVGLNSSGISSIVIEDSSMSQPQSVQWR